MSNISSIKIINFILLTLFLGSALNGQITEVSNVILNDAAEGFEFLEAELEGVQILGIGEATHGSEEFKVLQCNLFKYMVAHHGYNTFFLEDEYIYCAPIDDYIKGGEGNVDTLVAGLRNWPWETPQMISLIAWMRSYNEGHDNSLSFVGTDFQDFKELGSYLEKKFAINTMGNNLTQNIEALNTIANQNVAHLIKPSLLEYAKGDHRRDYAMGELILKYMELNKNTKGVFCAHNAHLLKVYIDKKNDKKDWALAGGVLDHRLKEKYYVLATDFDSGTFYAHSLKAEGLSKKEFDNHEFKVNKSVCEDNKFAICTYLKDRRSDIILLTDLSGNEATEKWMRVNSIGAVYYGKKKDSTQHDYYTYLKPDNIDGIMFFKTVTAATILKD